METEKSKDIDTEILGLSGGLFDEWTTAAGPPIDEMAPDEDHPSGPPTRRRAASTNSASWAVIAASAATLAGGVAAAILLSPTEAQCPGAYAVSAMEALPPGDVVIEAPAAAPEAALPPGAGTPPVERPAELPARPQAPGATLLPAATPWHSPIEALGARATEISRSGAAVAIAWAAKRADRCTPSDDPRTTMRVRVTFAPSGAATSAQVSGGPFVGTQVGRCIERALRGAAVRPFDGEPATVSTTIRLHVAPAPRRVAMGP